LQYNCPTSPRIFIRIPCNSFYKSQTYFVEEPGLVEVSDVVLALFEVVEVVLAGVEVESEEL
jgi:hypothetical protein